jgi:hypothetical protein
MYRCRNVFKLNFCDYASDLQICKNFFLVKNSKFTVSFSASCNHTMSLFASNSTLLVETAGHHQGY